MRIDFYVIEDEHPDAPRRVAARLLEKAYAQNLRAWILCANQKEAELLDDWLWTYQKNSFLPHSLVTAIPEGFNPPIQISADNTAAAPNTFDLLLNLGEEMPIHHLDFERVLDLVAAHQKEAGRTRYQSYKKQSAIIQTHTV